MLLGCPGNVVGVIRSYLSNRTISIFWEGSLTDHKIEKGCPQGSCLGPLLWLLIANVILKDINSARYKLLAFADDFSFIFSGLTRSAPEKEAATALSMFNCLLQNFHLQISSEKSQALTFAKLHDLKNSPSNFRINGDTIPWATSIKILGIKIDKHLSWFPHFNYVKHKLHRIKFNA